MAIIYVDQDSISVKTRSRKDCSPQRFIILKKELQRLEEKKHLITKDIHSYAELRICDAVGGAKVLELSFTWLKDAGRNSVSGYTEQVRLPYEPFRVYAPSSLFCKSIICIRESTSKLFFTDNSRPDDFIEFLGISIVNLHVELCVI